MRRKPYTLIGIRRLKCWRCGEKAHAEWSVCADNNVRRAICAACDVALNAMVLKWARDPDAARKMAVYCKKVQEQLACRVTSESRKRSKKKA